MAEMKLFDSLNRHPHITVDFYIDSSVHVQGIFAHMFLFIVIKFKQKSRFDESDWKFEPTDR